MENTEPMKSIEEIVEKMVLQAQGVIAILDTPEAQSKELKRLYAEALNSYTASRELEKKVVLYVNPIQSHTELSHEDRLKVGADEVEIYLGDTTKGVWGDDWNDAPDEHNSGTPYKETVKGIEVIRVKLGKPLNIITPDVTTE